MENRWLSFGMGVFAIAATQGAVCAAQTNEVVARVNGREMTRQLLDLEMRAMSARMASQGGSVPAARKTEFERRVLEGLIDRELVLQDGRTNLMEGLDARLTNEISRVKKQAGGEESFAKELEQSGLTEADFARRVQDDLVVRDTIEQVLKRSPTLGTNEVQAYFDAHREKFVQPEQVRASHILIRVPPGADEKVKADKRAQIEAARALVKGGQPFAEVATKFSEDPGSARQGGDLGFFPRGAMVPEFDTAAFALGTNELSEIITTQFGYHVLQVVDKKPQRDAVFEDVREMIERGLQGQKNSETVQQYLSDLRKNATIEILSLAGGSATNAPRISVTTPPMTVPSP